MFIKENIIHISNRRHIEKKRYILSFCAIFTKYYVLELLTL